MRELLTRYFDQMTELSREAASMDKVRLGLISCGNMGTSLARNASDLDVAQVVCCCDVDGDRAKGLAAELGADHCLKHEDLLARDDVDAVIVASPNHLHHDHTVDAARAGKHVFCEKPMALNVADCRDMIHACAHNGVKLMIGQVLRYLPVFQTITQLLTQEDFGRPFAMSTTRISGGWTGGRHMAHWRLDARTCGGFLYEVSQHELDFMRCLMGRPKSVFARLGHFVREEFEYPDTGYVLIEFENEGTGCLLAGHSAVLGTYDGKILCPNGTIYYDNGRGEVRYMLVGGEPTTV
ncbi:MAG: Gfo/Idh/MocA family protein, partial [Armatimonadota bacterium]